MNQSNKSASTKLDKLATIWSILEARKLFPAMIVVTGATSTDDTKAIARGLAEFAHAAGQRTGYLQLTGDSPAANINAPYAVLSIDPRGSQREAFDAASLSWRTQYDVIVADISTFGSEALGAHAARVSAGVVVALCAKRRVVPADRDLVRLLGQLGASVIGVVMTAPVQKTQPTLSSRNESRLRGAPQPQ